MSQSKDDIVRKIAIVWCAQPSSLPPNERLTEIASLLYAYRNNLLSDKQITLLPTGSISEDEEVMAAVEHYFFSRSQVANAEYSSVNMTAFILAYQCAKKAGVDLRHNKNKPTTAASTLQKTWALLGVEQGKHDLALVNNQLRKTGKAELSPPIFRLPPNFTGEYGGKRLDKVKY